MGAGGCSLQEEMVRSGLEKGMTFDYLEIQRWAPGVLG